MVVKLLANTPNPEQLIAAAAKLCYSSAALDDIVSIEQERAAEYLEKLPPAHESPLEHVSFTFGIEGVSRALLAQITRHRIASFSVQSQRCVDMSDFGHVVPESIAKNAEAAEMYDKCMDMLGTYYCYFQTAGIPDEDARFVLPNACETRMIVTMNARELLHFFTLRCCNRAQWEIRAVANEMLRLCKEVAPTIFAKAGAGCVRGDCREGALACGLANNKEE